MRPEILYPLFTPIASINGVGAKGEKLLAKLGIEKTVDLIWHFPHNIIDRTYSPALMNAQIGKVATVKVKILEHLPPRVKGKPYKVVASDGTEQITLNFFKVYEKTIQSSLPVGQERVISGKIEEFNGSLQMNHPDYMVKPSEINTVLGIEPVYPLTAGIGNKTMGKFVKQAVSRIPHLPEWVEENYKKSMAFPSFNEAMSTVHNPKSIHDLSPSSVYRTRLAYDELLANQLSLAIVRQRVKKQLGRELKGNGLLRKKLMENLPYELTGAQKRVLQEIFKEQGSKYRMLRLLQGDVGSGKTIVALVAMLNAIESGAQAAIMAPTEILAKQHLETIAPLAEEIGLKAELLTGRVKGKKRKQILDDLANGKTNIIIGTHALFVEDVEFKDLGFVVIDEQHRFGVHQRLALSNKGNKADILVMTATPIPRTLLLTAYGDMEYSKIDELPPGRKPVDTRVMPINKDKDIIEGLKRKLAQGERAYWVCPLVEESEKIDLQAAVARFEMLQKVFGEDVGLVHGKMKEKEKDEVMGRFKRGEIKLLVATTVIEVGVNVPEATIMIIEHAERFGLAQLHQLRGRIKRGIKDSSCILLYSYPVSETSKARLNIMKQTEDGFRIAEEDLELRGGGELLGTRQSGFADFKIADMSIHKGLLLTASQDAKLILEMDENLSTPRGQALRILLYLFQRDDAVKTYLA
ncbi:MAG: ATP-dependent DNA helicase RecG [Lactobacillus sp.]|jgi:ATP-dependent DNA helicase RecG|nr:ATP-dependent DNA helicase RecG [Lactobacillus sp.]